ncbi:MAG: phosphoribosylanthranilate isomerase [Acidobacteria bacterium]|nr:phosphoribosylanthranilate isomerase [Acidobacteriota bacterium]
MNVKICGVTNASDARAAVEFGADAIGLNFCPHSPRFLTVDEASAVIDVIPGAVEKVGVFVNETIDNMRSLAYSLSLDAIQLHGDESVALVKTLRGALDCKIIKAFRVSSEFAHEAAAAFPCDAVLLDGLSNNAFGGTGTKFDWEIARRLKNFVPNIYLAGGLTPESVAAAINIVRPFAVDVCSGIEKAKGVKDLDRMKLFIDRAKNTNDII